MDQAEKLLEEIQQQQKQQQQIDYISLALLCNGYSRSNQGERALAVLQRIEQLGYKPGSEVIDPLISVLARTVYFHLVFVFYLFVSRII